MQISTHALLLACCMACGPHTIGSLEGVDSAGSANSGGGVAGLEGEGGAGGSLGLTGGAAASTGGAISGASAGGMSAGSAGGTDDGVDQNSAGQAGAFAEAGAAGAGPSGPPVKALLLIDARLYALLADKLDAYRRLVEQRRGFSVQLLAQQGLDDLGAVDLKNVLQSATLANPELEGALFVGNLALPTFYKPRYDNLQTRLYPYFYEDLDATWMQAQEPGTIDPLCVQFGAQANCNTVGNTNVPPHDYDRVKPGPGGPKLWSAYWPVGVSGGANDYATFAAQLSPYLDKLLSFYGGQLESNGKYYLVSNDPGWSNLELLWNATPRTEIDFYGTPGPQGQVGSDCIENGQNLCYVRWPLETYVTFSDFKNAYTALPFLGEGWQASDIFMNHMNGALFEMVETNVLFSDYGDSLLTTQQASQLTKAGLVIALDGASVTGFGQPRADCTVDIASHLPSDSVGVAFLYGSSRALAVLGDPTLRGHSANIPVLYSALKTGAVSYLGAAHHARMQRNYAEAGFEQCVAAAGTNCGYSLSENVSEMLLGDPFLDFD